MSNELIEGILARAVRVYRIHLHAFVFTSNHFHLLASGESGWQLARFMQYLQSNIARKVGKLVGWRGSFFERRYSVEPVVDDAATEDRLRYILAHGVKEGLVKRCEDWPGVSSLPLLRSEETRRCIWRDWTLRWRLHRRENRDIDHFGDACPQTEEHLTLVPLPGWRNKTREEQVTRVNEIVREAEADTAKPTMGVAAVLAQDPQSFPSATKRTKRPRCHSSSPILWRAFMLRYNQVRMLFQAASAAWRKGNFDAVFPSGVFRPPWLVSELFER